MPRLAPVWREHLERGRVGKRWGEEGRGMEVRNEKEEKEKERK